MLFSFEKLNDDSRRNKAYKVLHKHCKVVRFSYLLSTLIIACIIFNTFFVSAESDAKVYSVNEFDVISVENNACKIELYDEDGSLKVLDKINNICWFSNPVDAEDDELASGIFRTNLRSQIVVEYIEDNSKSWVNNFSSSFFNSDVKYIVTKNKIRAEYTFTDEKFIIPVEYTVTNNGFKASIILKDIVEKGNCLITKIQLLPYFGACTKKDNSYMFVPDGCGAIINCNSNKTDFKGYTKNVYGTDKTLTPTYEELNNENILLPMYGMKENNSAFSAIITKGAQNAQIECYIVGMQCNYNRVYSTVIYRESKSINLKDNIGADITSLFTALKSISLDKYEISYNFLDANNSNYTGMALSANNWLKENVKVVTPSENSRLFLDFYGAAKKEKAFLGIRYTGVEKLTSFGEAKNIVKDIYNKSGASFSISFKNYNKATLMGKMAVDCSPMSELGGKNSATNLKKYINSIKGDLYFDVGFTEFSKSGRGFVTLLNSSYGLDLTIAKVFPYSVVTNTQDKSKDAKFLLKPNFINRSSGKLIKNLKKYDVDLLLSDSVNTVYSDYAKTGYQRDKMVNEVVSSLESIKNNQSNILMSAPNAYALPFASAVTDLPIQSSKNLIFDYDVPVLQIALRGIFDYSSTAINLGGYSNEKFLKLIETGSYLKVAIINENADKLNNTDLDYLYAASYNFLKDDIDDWYREINDVFSKIGSSKIVSHNINNDLVQVCYENSFSVYVNYGDEDITLKNGNVVNSKGYLIFKEK